METQLYQFLGEALGLSASQVTIEYQGDGLTNKNYIVTHGLSQYAVRLGGAMSPVLGIRREAEKAALDRVSAVGIGAEVLFFSPSTGNMVTRFIPGKKWATQDLALAENRERVAASLRVVHRLPAIGFEFSPYRDIERRVAFAREQGLNLPEKLPSLLERLATIEQARQGLPTEEWGLCHNDPFANNFLDDGSVRLLDWEYAGMGDVYFDLAAVSYSYTEEQRQRFLGSYFGDNNPGRLETLKQMLFVVRLWNALWGVVQTNTEDPKDKALYQDMVDKMFAGF